MKFKWLYRCGHPLSIHVDTFGTGNVSDFHLQEALASNDLLIFVSRINCGSWFIESTGMELS